MKYEMYFEVDSEKPDKLYGQIIGVYRIIKNNDNKEIKLSVRNEKYLTGRGLAETLKVSRAIVSKWTKEGLPCSYIGKVREARRGSRPRYDMDEVKAWLRSRSTYDVNACECSQNDK